MKVSKFSYFLGLLIPLFFACTEDPLNTTEDLTVENFEFHEDSIMRHCHTPCFTMEYPVSIAYPDGNTVSYDDGMSVKEALKSWRMENAGSYDTRPELVFPITVNLDDSTSLEVNSFEELKEWTQDCRKDRRKFIRKRKIKAHRDSLLAPCFQWVFPVSVAYPDGSEVSYEDKESMKVGLKEWKEENSEETYETRPEPVFPLTVVYEDGTEVEVASKEDLAELRLACKEE